MLDIPMAPDYRAALEAVALFDASAAGRLIMRDRDRAALLHRLSTNQIEKLAAGDGTQTVLTTPIGRIIDVLTVHVLPDEEALLLITSPVQREPVYKHLRKNIFFNDKVKVEDVSERFAELHLYGPQVWQVLDVLGLVQEPRTQNPEPRTLSELSLFSIQRVTHAGVALYVAPIKGFTGQAVALYVPMDQKAGLCAALLAAGATELSAASYEILRVEAGFGSYGHELSLEYIPLETGLWEAISFDKGCYVGQEIIARMESRNRMAKMLRGVRVRSGGVLTPGELRGEGKDAGLVTSVADSPRFGTIGLAYVRTAFAAAGTMLIRVDSEQSVEVFELPFR
ncbi:aminomethyl transferase family protein [Candidatus Gracilibacteria bacterium]|nr:aminomethyl transferase family protein [Candidatus Gracilibacteria bacterium]